MLDEASAWSWLYSAAGRHHSAHHTHGGSTFCGYRFWTRI